MRQFICYIDAFVRANNLYVLLTFYTDLYKYAKQVRPEIMNQLFEVYLKGNLESLTKFARDNQLVVN